MASLADCLKRLNKSIKPKEAAAFKKAKDPMARAKRLRKQLDKQLEDVRGQLLEQGYEVEAPKPVEVKPKPEPVEVAPVPEKEISEKVDVAQEADQIQEEPQKPVRTADDVLAEATAETVKKLKERGQAGFLRLGQARKKGRQPGQVEQTLKAGRSMQARSTIDIKGATQDIVDPFVRSFVTRDPQLKESFQQFRDDLRTEFQPMKRKISEEIEQFRGAIFGALAKAEGRKGVDAAMDLFYTKDLVQRAEDGHILPNDLTEEQVREHLEFLEDTVSQDVKDAAKHMGNLMEALGQELVARGKLKETRKNYAHHEIIEFMPEYMRGLKVAQQHKFKQPFRGYTKKAVGSKRLIRTDEQGFWSHVGKVKIDNRMEDFMLSQARKYDKLKQWRENNKGKRPKPVETIDGKRYKPVVYKQNTFSALGVNEDILNEAWTQDASVREWLDMTGKQGGQPTARIRARGQPTLFLLPEEVANKMMNLVDSSDPLWDVMYSLSRMTRQWKAMTLTVAGLPYQIGNLIGDTWNMLAFDPSAVLYMDKAVVAAAKILDPKTKVTALGVNEKLVDQLVRVAEAKDVAGSGFTAEIGTFSAITKGKNAWRKANEFREAVARLAILAHQLDRVNKGQSVQKVAGISTEGLDGESAAAKVAREALVDYVDVPKTYQRLLTGFAAPFIRFHEANVRNHVRTLTKGDAQAKMQYILAAIAPYLAAFAWNHGDDERQQIENQLPEWLRKRFHIVLGKDEEGRNVVIAPPSPVDMAWSWFGLDNLNMLTSELLQKRITPKEFAQKLGTDVLQVPADKTMSTMGPILQFAAGLLSNRDPFTKRTVMPESLHQAIVTNDYTYDDIKYIFPYVRGYLVEKMFTPIAQYTRTQKGGDPERNPFVKYLLNGPLDFKRAVGIYETDPTSGELSETYDKKNSAERKYYYWRQKAIDDVFRKHGASWRSTALGRDFVKDMKAAGIANADGQMLKWQQSSKAQFAIQTKALQNTTDPRQRKSIQDKLRSLRRKQAEESLKQTPRSVR